MFLDDIIIQPDCKMLFLLCFQSVNHYTSMLLSFLGVFEIHSVDWFGLVFVLPLLKNKNINYFQFVCTCTGPESSLWSHMDHPLFDGHFCCHRFPNHIRVMPMLRQAQCHSGEVRVRNCYQHYQTTLFRSSSHAVKWLG